MRNLTAIILLVASALAVKAEIPISGETFEALTTGKTFSYGVGGTAYGAEEYLPNRRVLWSFLDGDCFEGRWYTDGSHICFVYEGISDDQCWQFFQDGNRLTARFQGEFDATQIFEIAREEERLYCKGPDVGA